MAEGVISSETNYQSDLNPIDYNALSRLASKIHWKSGEGIPKESDVLKPRKYEKQPLSLVGKQVYRQAQESLEVYEEKETIGRGQWLAGLKKRDLEVQKALLSSDHSLNQTLGRIADRIAKAEKKLQLKGALSRTDSTSDYSLLITLRDNVNAFTFQRGKTSFFEGGFLVLLDKYLREVKGQRGLSEDHLASILVHEASHSNIEAKQSYLNEEYCDAQGVILASEAGYNPLATVDTEDFLIWLEKGADYYRNSSNQKDGEQENAISLSHPPSENRRLVIINLLKNNEGVVPNQTKDYQLIDKNSIQDLEKKMKGWVEERQKRVFCQSEQEVLSAIDSSTNLTELMEAMVGHRMFRKAQLEQTIINMDERLFDMGTLIQAFSYEIRHRYQIKGDEFKYSFYDKNLVADDYIRSIERQDDWGSSAKDYYKKGDITIGGITKNLSKDEVPDQDITHQAQHHVDFLRSRIKNLKTEVKLRADIPANAYKKGKKEYTDKEYQKIEAEAINKATVKSENESEKVQSILNFMINYDGSFDLAGILSGDFATFPGLQEKLTEVGITNFRYYLKEIRNTFRDFDINNNLKPLLSEKSKSIFPDSGNLLLKDEKLTKEQIETFLKSTKYYRVSPIINPEVEIFDTGDFNEKVRKLEAQKIREIAQTFSQSYQEQELLYTLLTRKLSIVADGLKGVNSFETDSIPCSLVSQSLIQGTKFSFDRTLERFESSLSKDFFDLRIAPSFGGYFLESYIKARYDRTSNHTGSSNIDYRFDRLENDLNFIKTYYREGFYDQSGDNWNKEYLFKLKERNSDEQVKLIEKRKSTIPVLGNKVIEEDYFEKNLIVNDKIAGEPKQQWDLLKKIAKDSHFEPRHLENIIIFKDIPIDEKISYLASLYQKGDLSIKTIFNSLIIKQGNDTSVGHEAVYDRDKNKPLYEKKSLSISQITNLKTSYDTAMAFLRTLPASPTLQDADISDFCNNLFKTKEVLTEVTMKLKSLPPEFYKDGHQQDHIYFKDINPYKGLSKNRRLQRQLKNVFDFVKEGGIVCLSEYVNTYYGGEERKKDWAGLSNEGAEVGLISLLTDLDYPLDLVKKEVAIILEKNRNRYSQNEIDKWMSLVAFCQQPYSLEWKGYNQMEIEAKTSDGKLKTYDGQNLDHVFEITDYFSALPTSTYKDKLLRELMCMTRSSSGENYYSHSLKKRVFDEHPGRALLEKKITPLLVEDFSEIGMGSQNDLRSQEQTTLDVSTCYVPKSENYLNDPITGFFIGSSSAAEVWSELIKTNKPEGIVTPFSINYRQDFRFQQVSKDEVEKNILTDRLFFLEKMPKSKLKEALVLYSIRSAYENLDSLENPSGLRQELSSMVDHYLDGSVTYQGRQGFFDLKINLEMNGDGQITAESIKERFPSRDKFFEFIQKYLPEKSSFRDKYILLATETYDLRAGDVESIRRLLFSVDYSTNNKDVSAQRAALEFLRSVKANEKITQQDLREMILWIIDKDRQVKTIEDFFTNLQNNEAGKKIMHGLLDQIDMKKATLDKKDLEENKKLTLKEKTGNLVIDGFIKLLPRMPLSTKKFFIDKIILDLISDKNEDVRPSLLMKSGMPAIIDKLVSNSFSSIEKLTFNSIIGDGGTDTPLKKEMFYDLVLGQKGILEEPIQNDFSTFLERKKNNFEGSEMHKFIDDILEIGFRRGGWDKKSQTTARIVGHSFIEAIDPVKRAEVLFNLLSELQKTDFSDKTPEETRSKFFQIALSSIGVVGAKLGQIDELIPKGWGSEMGSLKYSTKPMPKLMIADIFLQEGLSGDYIIENSAGAASTACGYIIANPKGEKEFAKVLRPEVKIDWVGDFRGVRYMLDCLKASEQIKVETSPIMDQIERLVKEELQTQKEINNVIHYVAAEDLGTRDKRSGIRAVDMPRQRFGQDRNLIKRGEDSLIILEELLPKDEYIELSKLNNVKPEDKDYSELINLRDKIDYKSLYSTIVTDFFHRALVLGNWHTDLHDGNILVSKQSDNVSVTRVISGQDLVLIDFGQTGSVETEEKRQNASRLLIGLALKDKELIANSIYEGQVNKQVSLSEIKKELGINPFKFKDKTTALISSHSQEEYMTNFLKATLNVLPYLNKLPPDTQFSLISSYIDQETREKFSTRIKEATATKNFTKVFIN